jgi:hypothetical protein
MQTALSVSRAIATAALAVFAPITAVGADSLAILHVKVFPDHYAVGEQRFSDVAALAAWLKPMAGRTLRLENCGRASTERLVAAVQHFYSLYDEGVTIRYLGDGCISPLAAPRRLDNAIEISSSPYLAVDAEGRGTLP